MKKSKSDVSRILAILALVSGIIYCYLYVFSPKAIPSLLLLGIPNNQENILIIGSDTLFDAETKSFQEDRFGNSDTIILAGINPFKKKINLVSIPRDTLVNIRGYGHKKINAAYLIGGPNFSETVVADNLGLKTSGYIALHLKALSSIIDTIGGLKIYVDKNMYYQDKRGKVFINLKKGEQVLNGKQAASFLRYRQDLLGDVARIRRQQRFVKKLIARLLKPDSILLAPKLLPIIKNHTKTNLSPAKLVKLLNLIRIMDANNIHYYTLPGNFAETKNKLSIWQVNTKEAKSLLKEFN